jgi:hypothetical protein
LTGIGREGTFIPTPSQTFQFASNWQSTVNGGSYLPVDGFLVPSVSLFEGEFIAAFSLYLDGDASLLKGITGNATKFTNGPLVKWWDSYDCTANPEDPNDCTFSAQGTYTLTRLPDGDPEPPVIPLPASAALLPLGLGTLAVIRRRKSKG